MAGKAGIRLPDRILAAGTGPDDMSGGSGGPEMIADRQGGLLPGAGGREYEITSYRMKEYAY